MNPGSKLVCIDLTPRSNSQTSTRKDILQVGGFSDTVFNVVDAFVKANDSDDYWVNLIEEISLDNPTAREEKVEVVDVYVNFSEITYF